MNSNPLAALFAAALGLSPAIASAEDRLATDGDGRPVELASLPTGSAVVREGETAVPSHEEARDAGEKDPLKFGLLKVGLDALLRGEPTRNFSFDDFTFAPENDHQRFLPRLRPSLGFTPAPWLTARVEGQWYASYGDVDFDELSLYQGFAEASFPSGNASLKVGRQELAYGSTFMLGADTFFDGSSFDAVKLAVKPARALSVELFAGKYVKANSGGIGGELYGVYGNWAVGDALGIDLYGILDTGGEGVTHEGKDERTYSIGARIAGNLGKRLALEVEPVLQLGRHVDSSHEDLRAFGGHVDLTVDPALPVPGKLLLAYAFGSGDGTPDDARFREFHNPNNDTPLIGDTSVIGDLSGLTVVDPAGNDVRASGLHVFTIGGAFDVMEKLNVSLDAHYFRAVATPSGISRDVGFETNLIVTYALTDQVSVLASANRFFTGSFFEQATGSSKDINYGYLQMQSTF